MEPEHISGPKTTAHSNAEQRMKVEAGKRKILRKKVRSKKC